MTIQPGPQKQPQPAPKRKMSAFLIATLATGIPLVIMGIISAGMTMAGNTSESGEFSLAIGSMLLVLVIPAIIGFAVARKRQIALGMLTGLAIGLVGLMLSCFATNWS